MKQHARFEIFTSFTYSTNHLHPIRIAIDDAFYLVLMMVFITPTANNIMVMVELGGCLSKEGIARLIGWQYATAPVILSGSIAIVVSLLGAMDRMGM